jgi:integrase
MASVFKIDGAKRYTIVWTDENGRRRKKAGYTDRRESERLGEKLEEEARKVKAGLVTRSEISITKRLRVSIEEHIDRYRQSLIDEDATAKHADLARNRLRKLFKIAGASTLRDITLEGTQSALAQLRAEGRGLKTLNHYGDTAKMFLEWCKSTHRIAANPLKELKRYNADTDIRHERRSISVEEFRRLLAVAGDGEKYGRMTGPLRELCYRFAFMTGLRFGEIKAMRPDWINWQTLKVTVPARVAKNRKTEPLPIDERLAEDLKCHIATLAPGEPMFPMPKRGYAMLQVDLAAAGIPYEVDGKHFDFHALRGMTATILDEIGTPDGVRRKLMRHSSQTMTNLYTRPRDDQGREAIERLADTLSAASRATKSATKGDGDEDPDGTRPDDPNGSGERPGLMTRVQFQPPPLISPLARNRKRAFFMDLRHF